MSHVNRDKECNDAQSGHLFSFKRKYSVLISFLIIIALLEYKNNILNYENNITNSKSNNYNKIDVTQNLKAKETVKKYSVISINLDTKLEWYILYLPMVCLSWRKLGFEPIILSTNSTQIKNDSLAAKTIEYLNLINIKIIHVSSVKGYEKMTGMLSRLFIGWIDCIEDDAFVLTTDSDLIPIKKSYYEIENKESIILLDAFHFGSFEYKNNMYKHYSMLTGMKKSKWKTIIQAQDDCKYKLDAVSILKLVEIMFSSSLIKRDKETKRGDESWWLDQHILSIKIGNYLKENLAQVYFEKPYVGLKLDRIYSSSEWNIVFNSKWNNIIDCHLFHETYVLKIKQLMDLFRKILSNDEFLIIKNYMKEFLKIRENNFKLDSYKHVLL